MWQWEGSKDVFYALICYDGQDKYSVKKKKQSMEKCAEKDATCVKRKNKYMYTHTRMDTQISIGLEGTRQAWLTLGRALNGW